MNQTARNVVDVSQIAALTNPFKAAMSPTPFPATSPLLGPITDWCLDTFDGLAPLLIGIEFGVDTVGFHPVELDPVDPIADLVGLRADPDWSIAVVIADVLHAQARDLETNAFSGILAYSCDREGLSQARLDTPCGQRRNLRHRTGFLPAVCAELFT